MSGTSTFAPRARGTSTLAPRARRASTFALVVAGVLGAILGAAWCIGLPEGAGAAGFAWFALGLTVVQAGAVALLWKQSGARTLGVVVALALVCRIGAWAWPTNLSSDVYRYVWDGRVQLAGHSPYVAPPGAESLASLRDDAIWPHINRKDVLTVYPPGAQLLFAKLYALGLRSAASVKAAAILAELVGMLLLAAALHRRGIALGRLAIYAWSPLVIAEVGVSGHLDAFVLPLLMLALFATERGARVACGLLLGFATLMKLYPLLLFAAVPREQRWRALGAASVLSLVLYGAYFAVSGPAVLGFLPDYPRSGEDFNVGVRGLVQLALSFLGVHARSVAMLVCGAALAGVVGWIAVRPKEDTHETAARIALAFVLLLPTAMHPWYALWMVPFLCVYPSPAGLWLAATLPLSYLKYGPPDGPMPLWVTAVIWIPPFVALGVAWAQRARTGTQ